MTLICHNSISIVEASINMHDVHLEISDGIIRLYTDDKPDKMIVDGEVVRR